MVSVPVRADRGRTRTSILIATIALMAAAAVLGTIAALVVPPGLPYDEPAHWSYVLFLLEQGRLPILGEPGVQYEAQQTPLYYVLVAPVVGATGESLLAARLFGVVGFVAVTGLTSVIAASVCRNRLLVTTGATAFVALNPMLAVMSASVQNDTWALVWALLAVVLVLRPVPGPRWLQGVAVGAAASLAILTKVSMAPLLIAIVVACLIRRRVVEPLAAAVVAVVMTGWWFARNLALYGDLTGQSAVGLTGAEFQNAPTGPLSLAQRVLTYLTLPTEYLRNTLEAPAWVDAAAIVVGLVLLTGLLLLALREWRGCARWPLLVVGLVAAVSIGAWLLQSLFGWPVAFRTAYAALPLFALAAGMATRVVRRRGVGIAVLAITAAAQLAASVWVYAAVAALGVSSML